MNATAFAASGGSADNIIDCASVPGWHREWIAQHAHDRAARTYLEIASPSEPENRHSVDSLLWETAGISIIHDVYVALALLDEDAETIRAAQFFGAVEFLRRYFQLLHTSGRGGRA